MKENNNLKLPEGCLCGHNCTEESDYFLDSRYYARTYIAGAVYCKIRIYTLKQQALYSNLCP